MPSERKVEEVAKKWEAKARLAAMRIVALTSDRQDPRFCRLLTSWEPDFTSVIAKTMCEVGRETRRETLLEAVQIAHSNLRHVELSPGVGAECQRYGIAVANDIAAELERRAKEENNAPEM